MSKPTASQHALQAPTGTRDFYPAELNRLRYIQKAWRDVSIRHGFEEIDGPTFEHLNLYTIKSGEGIVSELFSFQRAGGEKAYALRPEFTPTLARMYAAKANALPKPTKWFWMQNCFRAERPQRGRLREFGQWNCDVLGDNSPSCDAELILCCIGLLESLQLTSEDVKIRLSDRPTIEYGIRWSGTPEANVPQAFALLDRRAKLSPSEATAEARKIGLNLTKLDDWCAGFKEQVLSESFELDDPSPDGSSVHVQRLVQIVIELGEAGYRDWLALDLSIVRGLAYYTGMVFEVHEATGAERAIAGGGRYDNLIELFGGPPTPAVGFGMGDVVLSLVLQDKGLLPKDEEIADRLGLRPDVFVISAGSDAADAAVTPLVARLRRAGLHARRSYKTTKNIGKLLKDAASARARFAAIIEEGGATATIKNLDTGEQATQPVALDAIAAAVASRARQA